jgi:hypothetical protein
MKDGLPQKPWPPLRGKMLRQLEPRFDRDGMEPLVQRVTLVTPKEEQVAKPAYGINR